MAQVVLTTEQRIAIQENERFQSLLLAAIFAEAYYKHNLGGGAIVADADVLQWAKERFVVYTIVHSPNSIEFQAWLKQAMFIFAAMDVYDDSEAYTEDHVIDYMIANSKFTELAGLLIALRAKDVKL